jgi:hypothetical protein
MGSDDPQSFKHFGARPSAVEYARGRVQAGEAERGDIYVVADATSPKTAIAAVQKGTAELIQSLTLHASQAEIEAAVKHRWEEAQKQGADAVLKFLGLI